MAKQLPGHPVLENGRDGPIGELKFAYWVVGGICHLLKHRSSIIAEPATRLKGKGDQLRTFVLGAFGNCGATAGKTIAPCIGRNLPYSSRQRADYHDIDEVSGSAITDHDVHSPL